MAVLKRQRIRDPLHNLVEFDTKDEFEGVLWRVVQTRPFQRLRRIKQLGFSELVYPGATHTRFAHCIGVFHTARHLMQIIERYLRENGQRYRDSKARVALAASLVHDLGHGMFSHAFEDVGRRLGLKMADHEHVSDALIRGGEVAEILKELGGGFAGDVADVIKRGRPGNLYDAVVSSQFDADRLDYMQRDRLMTGVENSGIDFTWLAANLEIASVPVGVDEEASGEKIDTFVLGAKALHAAESYILALFQLYPTVYLHKTTRAAERLFSALMLRLVTQIRDGALASTALPSNHPITKFATDPDNLENALALDDSVFWGALPLLIDAPDETIRTYALRLRDRRLPKCIDIRHQLLSTTEARASSTPAEKEEIKKQVERLVVTIEQRLDDWAKEHSGAIPRIITDKTMRDPYKLFQESKGPLNQIHIHTVDGRISDVAKISSVIAGLEPFEVFQAYFDESDNEAKSVIERVTLEELGRTKNA